jgi:hypothetical protein
MHFRKWLTSVAQAPDDCCICAVVVSWCWPANSVVWGDASAGAEEPPPNQPPTAWPMEDPTATPLEGVLVV